MCCVNDEENEAVDDMFDVSESTTPKLKQRGGRTMYLASKPLASPEEESTTAKRTTTTSKRTTKATTTKTTTTESPIIEEKTDQADDDIFEKMRLPMKELIQEKCTKKNVRNYFKSAMRIVNGKDTDMKEHLWVVPILYEKKNSSEFFNFN